MKGHLNPMIKSSFYSYIINLFFVKCKLQKCVEIRLDVGLEISRVLERALRNSLSSLNFPELISGDAVGVSEDYQLHVSIYCN